MELTVLIDLGYYEAFAPLNGIDGSVYTVVTFELSHVDVSCVVQVL